MGAAYPKVSFHTLTYGDNKVAWKYFQQHSIWVEI